MKKYIYRIAITAASLALINTLVARLSQPLNKIMKRRLTMKRKFKSLLCLALSAVMLTGTCATAFAQENTPDSTPEYQETYLYIDFANLDISEGQDG